MEGQRKIKKASVDTVSVPTDTRTENLNATPTCWHTETINTHTHTHTHTCTKVCSLILHTRKLTYKGLHANFKILGKVIQKNQLDATIIY